jgi:hypothetical protein
MMPDGRNLHEHLTEVCCRETRRMSPFGMTQLMHWVPAPSYFQYILQSEVLQGLIHNICELYIKNMTLIYSIFQADSMSSPTRLAYHRHSNKLVH